MNKINQTIIDSIIKKAEMVCLDSLALIGIYGSIATGDEYDKSDLDLLILINNDDGWKLGCGFILDDTNIGYDIYCTNWDMLKGDAECNHAHLSKLLNSKIVYVQDESALKKLEEIKADVLDFLKSDDRFKKAKEALKNAKLAFGQTCLSNSVSEARTNGAYVISCLLDTVMLYNGMYFKLGIKRTFKELEPLNMSPLFMENINSIIHSKAVDEIILNLKSMILYVEDYISVAKKREKPSAENIAGTYEEMYSNWRNKVEEAAYNGDAFSSFMNLCSLKYMLHDIANDVEIEDFDIMLNFNPKDLFENIKVFDDALEKYKKNYDRAGILPKHYANVNEFAKDYIS